MALENTRAKATLDADTSKFRRELVKAAQSMQGLKSVATRVGSAITTVLNAVKLLGLAKAFTLTRQAFADMIDDMERRAMAVSRGAGGGTEAQRQRGRAARLAGEAADPFRFISPLGRLFATALPVPGLLIAKAFGSEQADKMLQLLAESRDIQKQHLSDLVNSSTAEAEGARVIAANIEAMNRRDVSGAPALARQARAVGLESAAQRLEQAVVDGVVDTVSALSQSIRRQIAARVAERTIYEEFGQ